MNMNAIELLSPKDRALFADQEAKDARGFFNYLFTHPKTPDGVPNLRSLAIGLYDPWCDRRQHPLGILWQSAPYSFCSHMCRYCYGRSYLRGKFNEGGREKADFRRKFDRCLKQMRESALPPRHLSMANSTDILQVQLERRHRHVLHMLERLCSHRDLFSSFGILTKSPGVLLDDERYVSALRQLGVEVQVSIAFFRDVPAQRLEPGAPAVTARRAAVEQLVARGVNVALRVDPLFPREITGCPTLQGADEDLVPLVRWAKQVGVGYVISKPLKLPAKGIVDHGLQTELAAAFPVKRGSYRRMTPEAQEKLVREMREICISEGIRFEHCFHNILKRNRITKPTCSS